MEGYVAVEYLFLFKILFIYPPIFIRFMRVKHMNDNLNLLFPLFLINFLYARMAF